MISVKFGTQGLDPVKWAAFVRDHPDGNIFQSPELYKVYSESGLYEPIVCFALQGTVIQGVLMAVIHRQNNGFLGKFTARSIVIGGPLVLNQTVAEVLISEYDKSVKRKAIYTQFRNIFSVNSFLEVFKKAGYKYEEHLDILMDLNQGTEAIWKAIHKNKKKEIKNGQKRGLIVKEAVIGDTENLTAIYRMLVILYNRIGLPVPPFVFFQKAYQILEPAGLLKTFLAQVDDKIIGFRMELTHKNLIYDWYAASDNAYLSYRPNDVLPWAIFKWGIENKYAKFDFGGAGKPNLKYGVRDYKLKFGGELFNNGRFTKVHKKVFYLTGIMAMPVYKFIKNAKL